MRIFGKGKCKLIANCANFWQGKCKFIANFSATMVTSLPSLSVCISLSLSLSLSLSHRKYLTHNIGSASALPIILMISETKNDFQQKRTCQLIDKGVLPLTVPNRELLEKLLLTAHV